jgi:hypothetical protein
LNPITTTTTTTTTTSSAKWIYKEKGKLTPAQGLEKPFEEQEISFSPTHRRHLVMARCALVGVWVTRVPFARHQPECIIMKENEN